MVELDKISCMQGKILGVHSRHTWFFQVHYAAFPMIPHVDCVDFKQDDHKQFDTAGEPILTQYLY